MSEILFSALPEDHGLEQAGVCCSIAAQSDPAAAPEAVINHLTGKFGPVITQIIDLIKSGITNIPAILASLQAAGITLPVWFNVIIAILLAVVK